MPTKDDQHRAAYASLAPQNYPDNLLLPVQEGLDLLKMYTQDLKVLMAPSDLCLQKAMEFLEDGQGYDLALNVFRHDLTQRVVSECEFGEVDALVAGVESLTNHLRSYFTEQGLFIGNKLAYVYERYLEPGMLVLTKLTYYHGNSSPAATSPLYHPAAVLLEPVPHYA